tara:strand:+ start:37 stop:297 length:261 start_codon:yes stop_codon:yes gene_type:complete
MVVYLHQLSDILNGGSMHTPYGSGVGNIFTPVLLQHGKMRIPVRLDKSHPDYEGYHEPFWVSPAQLNDNPLYNVAHRFTGARGTTH